MILALLIFAIPSSRPAAQSLTSTPDTLALTVTPTSIPPIPTITPTPYREPGDTTGPIVISVVLVLIIVIGVIMGQNLVRPRKKPQENNRSE
jgi:hypothetical protein